MGYFIQTERASVCIDGKIYTNIPIASTFKGRGPNYMYASDHVFNQLRMQKPSYSGTVPKNSKVYLVNDIPIDINIIRKSYEIKRKPEDADYIIYSPISDYSGRLYIPDPVFIVDPGVIVDKSNPVYMDVCRELKTAQVRSQIGINNYFYRLRNPNGSYEKFLTGAFTKPTAKYTQLDLSGGDDITYDVLALTYKLAHANSNNSEAQENLILNLKALNNYDWRNFKYAIGIVLRSSMIDYDAVFNVVNKYIKSQTKSVQDIITNCLKYSAPVSDKDRVLAREFCIKQLNMQNFPMFVSPGKIIQKVASINMSIDEFERLFSVVAKIDIK